MPGILTYDEERTIAARVHPPEINAELYGKTTIELMQLAQWLHLSDTTAHYARLAFHFAALARDRAVDLVELDTDRADMMRALLNETGRREIWKYDIVSKIQATHIALADQDYDNIDASRNNDHQYALIGPGIVDHYFTTPAELYAILEWLCGSRGTPDGRRCGYLSCYARIS